MRILVYLEHRNGRLGKGSFELASFASAMAARMNAGVTALAIGDIETDELKKAGQYGVEKLLHLNDSRLTSLDDQVFTSVIEQAVQQEAASVIILGSGFTGKALAPRLSVRLKAGLVPNAVGLPGSYSPFVIRKKTFSGKALSDVEVRTDVKIITLSPNSFGLKEHVVSTEVVSFSPKVDEGLFRTKVESSEMFSGKVLLTEADIVVSGGRGMKGPENWGPIEELASVLGAATACSRPVADEGWRPHTEHVGQTGKVIAPDLYIALGISGAIQHVAGVSSSKVLVAVNKDPEAPIFAAADYGIVGDVQKVIPQLIDAFRELKSH